MTATERWRRMVEEEPRPIGRDAPGARRPFDHWGPYAEQFRAFSPHRRSLNWSNCLPLSRMNTVIDVGAEADGWRRPQVPTGEHVEPIGQLWRRCWRTKPHDTTIGNVTVVRSRWEDAEIDGRRCLLCPRGIRRPGHRRVPEKNGGPRPRQGAWWCLQRAPQTPDLTPSGGRYTARNGLALPSLPQLRECWPNWK